LWVNRSLAGVDNHWVSWLARILPLADDRDEGVRGRSTWDRVLTVSSLSMLALLILLGVVFSVSYGSRRITTNATALHKADEMLRTSMVARAQLELAVNLAAVDREQGSNSTAAITFSINEAEQALAEMRSGFFGNPVDGTTGIAEDFPETLDLLQADIRAFGSTSAGVIESLEDNDSPGAEAMANEELASTFNTLQESLRSVRDDFRAGIEASSEFLGTLGSVTRFLVAFLIPAAVILLYRALMRRQRRQTELETRLQAERDIGHAREEFIANASHELRTPLTGIHGLAMLLEEDPAVSESEMASELIGLIVSESADLGRMVEDLLTTARLDAGALHYTFEDVEVQAEVNEVVEPMRRAGMSIGVECESGMVRADRLRFRQVLRNLLSNARKYGGPNVRIHGKLESNAFVCAVVDDGEGIPEELEARLFQRFIHQGHQTAVKESVGLGLSIVRSLIEGMGGNVYYERNEGETAFVIVMPLATGAPAETQLATPPRLRADLASESGVEVTVGSELSGVVD
jgi:signal transduction histidine kinase